jgi:hypothetical protein
MGLLNKIITIFFILAVIGIVAYYFNVFGGKSIVIPKGPNGTGAINYSPEYKVAVNITKKYNESINHLVYFTGNSSSVEGFSTQGTTDIMISYHGLYVPVYTNISDMYINGSSYFSYLIGKTVYVQSVAVYDHNLTIQVPYTVQSEKIEMGGVGQLVYWHLTQATGISNNSAVNISNNITLVKESVTRVIGIYYNGTEILFPRG